jgi:uncharacterized glyoxalase superfamily protein PhnB
MAVNAVPDGFHTLTPYLLVADARAELAFLKAAFGATAVMVMPPGADADGATETIRHAALQIGTSKLMMATAMPPWAPTACSIHLYLLDVDAAYARALAAGATSLYAPQDEFYGDRDCGVKDPQGNLWWIATHQEDLTPDDLAQRASGQGRTG